MSVSNGNGDTKRELLNSFKCAHHQRLMVYIDGANTYTATKGLAFDIDYRMVRSSLEHFGDLVRINYYTAINEEEDYSSIRPLIDWLDYNGFNIISKPAKTFSDESGRRKVKGNMDLEMAVDMVKHAYDARVDRIILFSGDGDFASVVDAVKERGVQVTVVSTRHTPNPMIADELRRLADNFIDLKDIAHEIKIERRPRDFMSNAD